MPIIAGETRLIAAAMAALPIIQKAEQGLATRIGNAASAFFAPTDSASSGQNVPSAATSSSANSAQSASGLSGSVTNALLKLQDSSSASQVRGHHHHHGAGKYKSASDMVSQLTDATSQTSASGAATTAVTA